MELLCKGGEGGQLKEGQHAPCELCRVRDRHGSAAALTRPGGGGGGGRQQRLPAEELAQLRRLEAMRELEQ